MATRSGSIPGAYFDTSAIVKRYLNEERSQQARMLIRRYEVVSSVIMPVEAVSAFARQRAGGLLREDVFAAVLTKIHTDRNQWTLLEVTDLALDRAESVVTSAAVHAVDGLHIASALVLCENSGKSTVFITADARQAAAARSSGLDVIAL